jgi:hypothetical protein
VYHRCGACNVERHDLCITNTAPLVRCDCFTDNHAPALGQNHKVKLQAAPKEYDYHLEPAQVERANRRRPQDDLEELEELEILNEQRN